MQVKIFCTANETLRQKDETFPGDLGSMTKGFTSKLKAEQGLGVQLPKFHLTLTRREKVLSRKTVIPRSRKVPLLVIPRMFTVGPELLEQR